MVEKEIPDKEYYLSTLDGRGNFLIYESEKFRLSEFDIINMIKICLIERRNILIGKKILEVYRDSKEHEPEIAKEKLRKIGIIEDEGKPTSPKRTKKK